VANKVGKVIVFGEVLFDIFPERKCLGGAPFNFAIHLHHFGVPVCFVSRVGNDPRGKEILDFARKSKLPTQNIQVDPKHPTGEVRVHRSPMAGHSFEIPAHQAWDYIEWDKNTRKILDEDTSLIYFGTLAQRDPRSRETLQNILKELPAHIPVYLDLNLRPPFYNRDILQQSLSGCNYLKANDEEVFKLKEIFNWSASDNLQSIARKILSEYDIDILCITKGEAGSEMHRKNREVFQTQKAGLVEHFQSSVGAGDAFSAKLVFGFLNQWKDEKLLNEASLFASQICTLAGAIPDNPDFYQNNG